jgi:hypothetical protein
MQLIQTKYLFNNRKRGFMKNFFYSFLITLLFSGISLSQQVWINEFSYDCADSSVGQDDGDEFIEIVAPVNTNMNKYGVVFFHREGEDFQAHTYEQLGGIVSNTNSNSGKGFFIVKTNRSHRLEEYVSIPNGISMQTIESEFGLTNDEGGILLVSANTGEIIHGICYELLIGSELPAFIINKLEVDASWIGQDFSLQVGDVDAIQLPLDDGENSSPNGSISMIGTGYSRLWTTTNGDAPNIGTPGALNYSQGALPVELSSFSASVIGASIQLNWTTETEVNNYGFDVERKSSTGSWEKISFVNGNGNSNSTKQYSFIDNEVNSGTYSYRLKQIDNDGKYSYSKIIEISLLKSIEYTLAQNYPNPFNPTTLISFTLPEAGTVKLTVYNLLGQEIKTLVSGYKDSGVHFYYFDAEDLNSGVYIYKFETKGFTQTRKMTLFK